mgnify:CR=1 FL=1
MRKIWLVGAFAALALAACDRTEVVDDSERCLTAQGAEAKIEACTAAAQNEALTPEQRSVAYSTRGDAQNDVTAALRDYGSALELDDENLAAQLGRGRILVASGQLDAAEPILRRAIELYQSGEANDLVGQIMVRRGEFVEAITFFNAALDKDPRSATALAGRARLLEHHRGLRPLVDVRRGRARGPRRAWQRLRRGLRPLNLAAAALVVISAVVVVQALRGPPTRVSSFRTDPVLRALRIPDEEPTTDLAALTKVPSLSASPRFVLPLVRGDHKRLLAGLPPPAEPVPPAAPVVVARPVLPETVLPETVPPETVPPAPAPVTIARLEAKDEPKAPAPSVVLKPAVPTAPLTTALTITPVLPPPRRETIRPGKEPLLAIVIDDMGPPPTMTHRAIQLPAPVTLSFLPYAEDLPATTAAARAHGHEVYLHLPMEPIGNADPGPNAILVGLDPEEFDRRLSWAFERVPLATGLNNHMGSRATSEPESMLKVLREVRRHGMTFVDSRTSPLSVGDGLAAQLGIPHAARDVFLDNSPAPAAILRQLTEAERLARRRGHALAIGHPYPTTLAVLDSWLPAAQARGLKLVTASGLIAATSCDQPAPLQVWLYVSSSRAPKPCSAAATTIVPRPVKVFVSRASESISRAES